MSEESKVVLIVEANPDAALALAEPLRRSGWTVAQARDGMQGLAQARQRMPDAIVLNAELPAGGGLALLERLRRNVHTTAIPVVALGKPETDAPGGGELLAAGAQAYFDLPASPDDVARALDEQTGGMAPVDQAPREAILEPERLAALDATGLLDAETDPDLQTLTVIATELLDVPVALFSLVDRDRQFFATHVGLPDPWAADRETPLSHSFCQWVASGEEPLLVADAREHPTLAGNLAVRDIGVVAYAGVPISAPSGHKLGSFCGIDSAPHHWSEADRTVLGDLVDVAGGLMAVEPDGDGSSPWKADEAFEAITRGIAGASRILRRDGDRLSDPHRTRLRELQNRQTDALSTVLADRQR